MSVINRVLKDLERRHAPEVTQASAFPPGVRPTRALRPSLTQWTLLAVLLVALGGGVYWWRTQTPSTPVSASGPIASGPVAGGPPAAAVAPAAPLPAPSASAPAPVAPSASVPATATSPGVTASVTPSLAPPAPSAPVVAPAPAARPPLPAPATPAAKSTAAPARVAQASPSAEAVGKPTASQRAASAALPTTGVAPDGELRQAKPNVKPEPLAPPPAVVAAKPERQEPRATKHIGPEPSAGSDEESPLHEELAATETLPELPPVADPATKGAAKSARAKRDVAADVSNTEKPGSIDKQVKPPTNADRADAEFRSGMEAYHAGRFEEADAAWTRAMRLDPGAANARQALLGMLLDRGERARAEQVLKESLQANPRQAKHAMLLARLQLERGSQTEALRTLEDGLPHAQWSAEYLAMTATVLSRTGRNRDAAELYRSALRVGPANPVWEIGLGMALRADGRRAEAREAFEHARESKAMTADLLAYVDRQLKELR